MQAAIDQSTSCWLKHVSTLGDRLNTKTQPLACGSGTRRTITCNKLFGADMCIDLSFGTCVPGIYAKLQLGQKGRSRLLVMIVIFPAYGSPTEDGISYPPNRSYFPLQQKRASAPEVISLRCIWHDFASGMENCCDNRYSCFSEYVLDFLSIW